MKAFLPPDDPLALLLMRLRRLNISSEDMAAAVREQFDVRDRRGVKT